MDMTKQEKQIGRIRYAKNHGDFAECYIFEYKNESEAEWTYDAAYPIVDDTIHYSVLNHIKLWQQAKIEFRCLW